MRLVYRFGIVFLVVVLVAGAVLTVTFDSHRTDVAENAERSVADRASLTASALDDRLVAERRTVGVAATNPDLAAHGTDRQDRALERFVSSTAFDGATVVNDTGRVQAAEIRVAGVDSDELVGDDVGDRRYVRRSLEGERYVSEPFRGPSGATLIAVSAPVLVDGEIVGSLTGVCRLDETDLFESLDGTDDRAGITVEAGDETLYTTADRFDDTVARAEPLETVDWTVTAHRDREAMEERINRLVLFQLVSGVALLGSIAVFGGWVYRSKIRRIDRLGDRVRALERREYDGVPALGGATEWRRIDEALGRLATALARREQMLLVLNRILRHNLRNSLNVVAGRAADLEERLEGDERASAREIRVATDELLRLADRARTTEALLDPVDEPLPRTDLAAVVRDRVDSFVDDCEEPAPTVTVTAPERAVAACGPEVGTAIDELLANVADHAGPAPTVAVTVEETDDCVRLRIDDDGPGIPDDEAAVITGTRAISQVTHTGGIGLWLVDWIVSRYDGRLLIPPSRSTKPDAESGSIDREDTDDSVGAGGATVVLEFDPAPNADRPSDADEE